MHRRFPTREDVLEAVADSATGRFSDAYIAADLASAFETDETADASTTRFIRLAEQLIPLGAHVAVLLRSGLIDDAADGPPVTVTTELDAPLLDAVSRGQSRGVFRGDHPARWIAESFLTLTYLGWEQVRAGVIAPASAATIVFETWMKGNCDSRRNST